MIKFFTYFISFLIGRYNSFAKPSAMVIIDQVLLRTRKLLMTSMISLIASLLLTGGVIISLIEFTRQIDRFQIVWPSATLIGGLALTLISLATLIYAFTSKAFDLRYVKKASPTEQIPRTPSPLEEALSVLVMDFIKERREERQKPSEKTEPSPTPRSTAGAAAAYENTTLQ
jgi:hypothetical protein